MDTNQIIYLIGETNFIVDLGYHQDKNVTYLFDLVLAGRINLVVPELSLHEMWGVFTKKSKKRLDLSIAIKEEANQMKRSDHGLILSEQMKNIGKLIEESVNKDKEIIDGFIQSIKEVSIIIPYTTEIHKNAFLMTLNGLYGLTEPDASIYESINAFVKENNGVRIHLNKNTKDFDKDIIHKEMNEFGAELYFDSGNVIKRVGELLNKK
ncbi:MAG: hypothetical protein CVT89_06350 [Candidatus Altiarchaeales archaeon HGW-Altiarchaeales-2]|nr:MAG: hypothetical protein CVT89_06350 [Candidatus Altiarchaeales archaeon HGW-Altiarchaeales-2]